MSTELDSIVCGECGVEFAVPQGWLKERREDKREFYCPNGHPRVFRVSTTDALRTERDRLSEQLTRERSLRLQAEQNEATARKSMARMKKRTVAGSNVVPMKRAK